MTSNRAFVLRPSITDWIMKKLHTAEKKGKSIGILLGKELEPQRALQPHGKRFKFTEKNTMKQCKEETVFNEWDTELDLNLSPWMCYHLSAEELETLARNISQLDRLQRLTLLLDSSLPPPRPNQLDCATLENSSFVQSLQI